MYKNINDMSYRIFVINPGSTSTKLAYFEDEKKLYEANVFHDASELAKFDSAYDQLDFRKQMILEFLDENGIDLHGVDAIVGRGGSTAPINGGVYAVNDKLLEDTRNKVTGVDHPANLGVPLAQDLAAEYGGIALMVDGTNNALGEGPFTPTRTGTLPVQTAFEYFSRPENMKVGDACTRSGGFVSHFGTSNSDKVHEMVESDDPKAVRVWKAMLYNICKSIGEMAVVLSGNVDAIILGGGLLRFEDLCEYINERCGWIAPVYSYPGEVEHEAMAAGALRVLRGEEVPQTYTGIPVWKGFKD